MQPTLHCVDARGIDQSLQQTQRRTCRSQRCSLLLLLALAGCCMSMVGFPLSMLTPVSATLVSSTGYLMDSALQVPSLQVTFTLYVNGLDIGNALSDLTRAVSDLQT